MAVAIETGPYPMHSSSCGSFVKCIITFDGVDRYGPPVAPPAGAYGQHGGFDPAPVEPFDRQNTARIEEIARGMTIKERHKLAGDDFLKVEDENVARPHFAEGT